MIRRWRDGERLMIHASKKMPTALMKIEAGSRKSVPPDAVVVAYEECRWVF